MKIALINPPYLIIYQKINIEQSASLPLGLLYIAAALEKAGHEVKISDPNLDNTPLPDLIEEIRVFKPDLIAFTATTPTFNSAQRLAAAFKQVLPAVPVVLGGPHVSALPAQSLRGTPGADFIVIGEGEITMPELAGALAAGRTDFSSIPGICFRQNNECRLSAPRPLIEELDVIPYPAYHLVAVERYSPSVVYRVKQSSIFVMSSRGCPAFCTFCANRVTGRHLRVHSTEYFLGLLRHIIDQYGIRHFHLVDDNFLADKKRAAEICRRILEERLNITWFIFARADDCLDTELLALIKKAGCVYVQLGIESGNEKVLRHLGKKISKEVMLQACRNCQKAGLDYFNSFMIGNPGDTRETVLETVEFAVQLDSIMAGFNTLIPYPGTAIFDKYYKAEFAANDSWEKWNHITHEVPIDYRHTALTKTEIDRLRKFAIRRFYLRPRQLMRILFFFKTPLLLGKFLASCWKHLFFLMWDFPKTHRSVKTVEPVCPQ